MKLVRNLTNTSTQYFFKGVVVKNRISLNETHNPNPWYFAEAAVHINTDIDGLGPLEIKFSIPISKSSLDALSVQQIEKALLQLLPQTIQEQPLHLWIEKQSG